MIVNSYRELIVWQKSKDLISITYSASKKISNFSYRDQLNRATLSISNNIAEGFGRKSKREFKRFLNISLGSSYEVESMLIIFKELNILPEDIANLGLQKVDEVIRLLIVFISKIKT